MATTAIGIDVGGTGIKGALVDVDEGTLLTDRFRIPTPEGARPKDVLATVTELLAKMPADAAGRPIGIALPAVVTSGRTRSAANIDKKWIDFDANAFFSEALATEVFLVNDADAAGIAETSFGAAKGQNGLVILTTLGTGIGSAIINNGALVPNSELGHIDIGKVQNFETYAATSVREREGLSYEKWAKRLSVYYQGLESLFWPDLFVIGGGVSKSHEKFLPLIECRTPLVPAQQRNNSGILGAAALAVTAAH